MTDDLSQAELEQISRDIHAEAKAKLADMPKRFPDTIGNTDTIPDDVMSRAMAASQAAMTDCLALMSDGSDGINWTALLDHFVTEILSERERCAQLAMTAVEPPEGGEHWIACQIADAIRKGEA